MRNLLLPLMFGSLTIAAAANAAEWKMAQGPLATRWAKDVSPTNALPEYPRPQMARNEWLNLNGLWDYAIRTAKDERPQEFDGQVLVPYPIESALSGVMKRVDHEHKLWYRRTFSLPGGWSGQRVLLHFGAVDWATTVWINGKQVGEHFGGYDPFSSDITDALVAGDQQELVVAAGDPTDRGPQPRGKQIQKPESIWYTPTTGIWQTVWIEPVPAAHISRLKITPDVDAGAVDFVVETSPAGAGKSVLVSISKEGGPVLKVTGKAFETLRLKIPNPVLWSPDKPHLYEGVDVRLLDGNEPLDAVGTYFGMRKIALGKDPQGITRIMLNHQPVFQFGPLDQGFWPDGLYTAPTDAALKYDIEVTKQLGFNMCRKHVKVEPARWYYWCDKLGLLVWQDMPSGDKYIGGSDPDIQRAPDSVKIYEREWTAIVRANYNSPSIVMWVPFNEGWGQFDTKRIVEFTKKLDPTRLVDNASGWADRQCGDVHDLHIYPGPGSPQPEEHRAAVLGEFGGLGLPLEGHTWQGKNNWGYVSYKDQQELTDAYVALIEDLHPLIRDPGLSAAVYTQTTDVEIEVNGLMTYDRATIKPDAQRTLKVNRQIYGPAPAVKVVLPTSEKTAAIWRYTLESPAAGWIKPKFDDAKWREGPGGFGTSGTPAAVVRTEWKTGDIWLRRTVDLPAGLVGPRLLIHHDEDAEVYINGVLAAQVHGYTTRYIQRALRGEAQAAIVAGKNVIAVHCKQTGGGQYIDLGIVDRTAAAATAQANGEQPNAEQTWRSLFDGQSLAGWKETPFAGRSDVEVRDGQLLLRLGSELTGVTCTHETPRMNYELALDAMRVDGNDFFCGLTFPVNDDPCSLILGGWGGGVVGLSSLGGFDAANNETTRYREFKKGRWYQVRLRVTPGRIRAWLDEEPLVDVNTTGKRISIRSEVELSRPLGIASYSTTAALKNIRVRELSADEE